ncbi:MAG: 5-bromo-4-chloroindolyl phosphate hydrolysis family protein [Desulfovibrio sp.]|jgi:hypothetical protein|nr:5-bromo-4-chloroindolyl phosphate hydrolysis family protein [Desulfovibrio sp.]
MRPEKFPGRGDTPGATETDGTPAMPPADGETSDSGQAARWLAKGLDALTSLGKRIFTHIAILVGAAAVAFSAGSLFAGLCVYVGGVCILARDMSASPAWLIPAAAGAAQTILCVLFSFPFPQALFWGGAQSWLQRLLEKRLRMGTEWVMLLFLLPIGIHLLGSSPLLPLGASFAGLALTGGLLAQALSRRQTLAAQARELREQGPPTPERVALYRSSLAEFTRKIKNLPPRARAAAESLAARTGSILDSMASDTRDLEPGHRFLNRYFKAAHSVVDRHISLAREEVLTPEIMEALSRSEETLTRLDAVFAREHARLLENDVSDFSADLAVIDTLLKMDGRESS